MNSADINQQFDLLTLVSGNLRKVGRYHVGPCPFCGGHDRFTIKHKDEGDRWHCRHCGDGKYHTVIDFIMRRDRCDFKAALETLGGDTERQRIGIQAPPIKRPDNPPCEAWQIRAWAFIEWAESVLWSARGKDVLAWLRSRGLSDETIRDRRLGCIPKYHTEKPEAWGTPNDDMRPISFYEGLLIPGIIAGKVWYLKMRPSHPRGEMPKYINIRGGKSALYGADCIVNGLPAIFCEGELDAILLRQEVKELASIITLGSATNELNVATWGIYLVQKNIPFFMIAYDMDSAGNGGANKLTWLHDAKKLHIPILRKGDKDLTDFHKSGGNLYSLIESVLCPGAPIFVKWPEDAKPITIRDQYCRMPDNKIRAFYLPQELDQCLQVMKVMAEPDLVQV